MHGFLDSPGLGGIFKAVQGVVVVAGAEIEKKVEERNLIRISRENRAYEGPEKAKDRAVLGLGHKPIIRGHLVVFLGARHAPGSFQRHLITQTGQVANDPVIFRLGRGIESNGFTTGGEALATEFGDVKAGLELWNRMQIVFLNQLEQASLRRTYPHTAGVNSAACDLCDFDAAADAIPGFEYNDLLALVAERSSRAQPGETCTNNHNFGLNGRALVGGLGRMQLVSCDEGSGTNSQQLQRVAAG